MLISLDYALLNGKYENWIILDYFIVFPVKADMAILIQQQLTGRGKPSKDLSNTFANPIAVPRLHVTDITHFIVH